METQDVVVKVPAHAAAFGQEIENFLMAVDKAVEDGWQTSQDIPPIISSAIKELVPVMKDFKDAQAELKEDVWGCAKGLMLNIMNVVKAFLTKG